MKKVFLLAMGGFCICLLSVSVSTGNEVSQVIGIFLNGTVTENEQFIREQKYPYVIEFKNDGGETVRYEILDATKFPREDVPTPCPTGKHKIKKCWFVKYGR